MKSGAQLLVNQTGVLDQRSLSKKELRNAGQAFSEVLGGINPVDIGPQTDQSLEEMHSPESQPSFEEILEDNYLYFIAGVISLGIILLMIRKFGIGITKPMVTSERPKKDSSEDGWETARFCSQCNQAIPLRSKFCPSCRAKQS